VFEIYAAMCLGRRGVLLPRDETLCLIVPY